MVGSGFENNEIASDSHDTSWDYNKLMSGINPELRKKIQKLGAAKKFLAWLIAGSLNADIHSPLSFAVAVTLENQKAPTISAIRLAELQADELSALLKKTLRRMTENYLGPMLNNGAGSEDLASLLQPVPDIHERLRLLRRLADALGLED